MKTIKLLFVFTLLFLFANLNAQIRVLQDGRVQFGVPRDYHDPNLVTNVAIFGKYGDARAGGKLTFGDFGKNDLSSWNVFVGEYGTTDTDQLWLHGKSGFYLTYCGDGSGIVAQFNPAVNSSFIFNTSLVVNGVSVTSDARLKKNIQPISNPLGILNQLDGVSYSYNLNEIQQRALQAQEQTSSEVGTIAQGAEMSTSSAMTETVGGNDKTAKDLETQAKIEENMAAEANRQRIGFLAQDVQRVLPDLVQTDDKGDMSIDYIGFIPIIIESIKEMQQTIQDQKEQIERLEDIISGGAPATRANASNNGKGNAINISQKATLANREGAAVSYSIPTSYNAASVQIFDVTGRMVKTIELQAQSSVIDVNRSEIGFGTFVYALVVDGEKVDTLKKYIN